MRAAAPDDDVRKWHAASGRATKEWAGQDKPTRALRVKFIVQRLGSEDTVVVAQYDVTTVRSLLLTAESLLTTLFLQ
jgi:hypothetical protein